MFLHVSVILFTGGGVCPIACWDTPPPPWDQRCAPYPPGTIGADTPQCSACWEIRATSGRYASYWNAILFLGTFVEMSLLLIPDVSLISSGNDNGPKFKLGTLFGTEHPWFWRVHITALISLGEYRRTYMYCYLGYLSFILAIYGVVTLLHVLVHDVELRQISNLH